jgi:hypothetical protein
MAVRAQFTYTPKETDFIDAASAASMLHIAKFSGAESSVGFVSAIVMVVLKIRLNS